MLKNAHKLLNLEIIYNVLLFLHSDQASQHVCQPHNTARSQNIYIAKDGTDYNRQAQVVHPRLTQFMHDVGSYAAT